MMRGDMAPKQSGDVCPSWRRRFWGDARAEDPVSTQLAVARVDLETADLPSLDRLI